MATFKLNIGRITGPATASSTALASAIRSWPYNLTESFYRLEVAAKGSTVTGQFAVLEQKALLVLNRDAGAIEAKAMEAAAGVKFAAFLAEERVETYGGALKTLEDLHVFLLACGMQCLVENVEIDLAEAITTLTSPELNLSHFQLRGAKICDYSASSYDTGVYGPKFLDTVHGQEFIEKYAAGLVGAQVRWAGSHGKVNLSLIPRSCFSFSCHEDDQALVTAICRMLAGWLQENVA